MGTDNDKDKERDEGKNKDKDKDKGAVKDKNKDIPPYILHKKPHPGDNIVGLKKKITRCERGSRR